MPISICHILVIFYISFPAINNTELEFQVMSVFVVTIMLQSLNPTELTTQSISIEKIIARNIICMNQQQDNGWDCSRRK